MEINVSVLRFGRHRRGLFAACVMLAGCGGSQLPIVAPGLVPRGPQIAARAEHARSWMLPTARNENLVYFSYGGSEIDVFQFPKGTQIGSIADRGYPEGLCSDQAGNVFVVDMLGRRVQEYAHGALEREASLKDPMKQPVSCSVNNASGDLAVLNLPSPIAVEVFTGAAGKPRAYVVPEMNHPYGLAYDGQGDLFVDGTAHDNRIALVELPAGGSKFVEITVKKDIVKHIGPGPIQWDGGKLALEQGSYIDRLAVNGKMAALSSRVSLGDADGAGQFWIQGKLAVASQEYGPAAIWKYPAGGKPVKLIPGATSGMGVTVSLFK